MFTPKELDEITFGKAMFGGYDVASVDKILEPLTQDYVALYKENALLKSKMRMLVKKMEETPKASDETIIADARKAAEQIVQEAQAKAARILAEAAASRPMAAPGKIAEIQQQLSQLVEALEALKAEQAAAPEAPQTSPEAIKPALTGKGSVDRPWMKFYPPGIEQMMAVPPVTLNEYMKMMCRGKELPVIHYYGTEITWDEFFQMVDATARALRAAGLGEGDQIPVLLRAVPEFLVILLAAEKIGASILCRDNTIEENAEAIEKAGAKIMFAHDFITRDAVKAYAAAGIERIITVDPWKLAVKLVVGGFACEPGDQAAARRHAAADIAAAANAPVQALHTAHEGRIFFSDGFQQQLCQDLTAGIAIAAQFHDFFFQIHGLTSSHK